MYSKYVYVKKDNAETECEVHISINTTAWCIMDSKSRYCTIFRLQYDGIQKFDTENLKN